MVAQVRVGPTLLGADEVLELHRITHEEHRRVVPHHVVVALGRVELQREPAWVTPRVRAAPLAGNRREADQGVGRGAGLEDRRLRELADVGGDLEVAERATPLRMRLAFGDPLPVEIRHLLNQVVVLQQDGAIGTDGQRVLVAGHRDPGVRGCRICFVVRHGRPLCSGVGFRL